MNDLRRIIEDLLRLIEETEEFHQDTGINGTLKEARTILLNLHRRLPRRRHSEERFVLALVGLSGVGKSTLLNALLGYDLAPRRNGPCTSAPIEFHYSETFRVVAHYRQGMRRPKWECQSSDHVHGVLRELAESHDSAASNDIARVEVSGPILLLADGLIIADTPGFGAGQVGDAIGTHEHALKEYLEAEVSQVLWIIRVEVGIGATEMKFYNERISGICDDLLVTGCEDWSDLDRQRFKRRFSEAFKKKLEPSFLFLSGLKGLEARAANDQEGLERAGITALEHHVKSPEGRLVAMEVVLRRLAEDLGFWMWEYRDPHGRRLETVWHPPTLAWWIARGPGGDLKQDLIRSLLPIQTTHA